MVLLITVLSLIVVQVFINKQVVHLHLLTVWQLTALQIFLLVEELVRTVLLKMEQLMISVVQITKWGKHLVLKMLEVMISV
jgi:hypothetical protein